MEKYKKIISGIEVEEKLTREQRVLAWDVAYHCLYFGGDNARLIEVDQRELIMLIHHLISNSANSDYKEGYKKSNQNFNATYESLSVNNNTTRRVCKAYSKGRSLPNVETEEVFILHDGQTSVAAAYPFNQVLIKNEFIDHPSGFHQLTEGVDFEKTAGRVCVSLFYSHPKGTELLLRYVQ